MPRPVKFTRVKRKRSGTRTATTSRSARSTSREHVTETVSSEEDEASGSERKRVRWEGSVQAADAEKENGDEEEESDTVSEDICFSIACFHRRIGGAYYDPQKATMYVLEDTTDSAHYDVTQMLIEQASPNIVITGSRSDDKFIEKVREISDSTSIKFQIRPKREYNTNKGYERLLTLRLFACLPNEDGPGNDRCSSETDLYSSSEPRNAYDFMRRRRPQAVDPAFERWNASIRLANFSSVDTSPICIAAIGALLDHLSRMRAVGELEDEGIAGLEIRNIESLALDKTMQINADALSSLQIFDDENHAYIHSDKTKEGLSLFGILNCTRTSMGRKLLRNWFLRPSLSLDVIQARHDALSCFLRSENLVTAATMHGHVKNVGNIPHIFHLIRGGKAGVKDWQLVVKFVFHASLLRGCLSELNVGGNVEIVKKLIDCLDTVALREIGNMINEIIDWEESFDAGRVCVRPHVDEELDEWKRTLHGLDSLLSRVAGQIADELTSDYTESLNVVYFPQLGFLTCIPLKEEWQTPEGTHVPEPPNEEFTFQFCTEKSAYFKSPKMHDLDQHIGDLHPAIVDREIEIIQVLEEKVVVHDEMVKSLCDVCAELDCLLSLSEASREYEYTRPKMTEENIIDIQGGRHPLQERVVDTFVPNDVFLVGGMGSIDEDSEISEDAQSVIVCTGANACGKSVYLKQTALIVYMAQIGCFVPAASATLGIVDKIFTRVQTRESVSRMQSAFMIDLNQVSFALRNMTPRSLLILDEFGKGTISSDGAGLFCATLTYCLSLGSSCPKVIAATHFHDVFHENLLSPSLPIFFVHMEILLTTEKGRTLQIDGDDGDDDNSEGKRLLDPGESITYLYRVAKGLCLDSHAAKCALVFGIPPRLVRRAQTVSNLLSAHAVNDLLDEAMTPEEEQELTDAEAVCRKFLEWDLSPDGQKDDKDARTRLKVVLGRQ
ncbi:hypothetical protein M422DRAFT_73531 [Sphaerobolus stellatus SS14]|nr:hypothetical protein M422DRAFT_73531 [Sphaerobolus stellatus SS14]